MLYLVQNPHSLAELTLAHSSSSLSSHTWTTNWNILVAANYCTSKSLFIDRAVSWPCNLTTCLCTLIFTSDTAPFNSCGVIWCPKVAASIIWAALVGARGGQHREVLLSIILKVYMQFKCVNKNYDI
jgi:hypothetical protein